MSAKPYEEMTKEEKLNFFESFTKALSTNDERAINDFYKIYPLHPVAARAVKNALGADYLVQGNFNLSRAEVEYGANWLTQ